MPVRELIKAANLPYNLQKYVGNMIYVGVAAYLLEIEMDELHEALIWNFGGKPKPIEMNWNMLLSAFNWAQENIVNDQPYRCRRMTGFNEGKVLIDGNTAAGLGALYNGITFMGWYPITPSSSLADAVNSYAPKLHADPETGELTVAVVQAEDELAAAGMVLGAGWAGARAMTATSGPGISLMAEFVGLGYFAEIPSVFWDVQRMGPQHRPAHTHRPDRHSIDLLSEPRRHTGHVLLFPATPKEAFEMAGDAFDLAERLQTPIFVMSNMNMGMNLWVCDEFEYPDKPLERWQGAERRGSQGTVAADGGAILMRMGTGFPSAPCLVHATPWRPIYRGTGHAPYATYSERPEDWENNLLRLRRKFDTARDLVPAPVVHEVAARASALSAWAATTAQLRKRAAACAVRVWRHHTYTCHKHCPSMQLCVPSPRSTTQSMS